MKKNEWLILAMAGTLLIGSFVTQKAAYSRLFKEDQAKEQELIAARTVIAQIKAVVIDTKEKKQAYKFLFDGIPVILAPGEVASGQVKDKVKK